MRTLAAVLRSITDRRPYDESAPMTIEELELPEPRAGELLIRIEAAGVCHSDVSVVDGSRVRPLPMALGHESAGVVEEVGEGIRDVREGDHVVLTFVPSCGICVECAGGRPALCLPAAEANGSGALLHGPAVLRDADGEVVNHHLGVSGFAQHAVVARESAVVIPDDVPLATAALFGCAVLTGTGAVLNTAQTQPGQSVAVFGLGGVGLAAVMGAVAIGAYPVIGVDPVASKRELALELGATAAVAPDDVEAALEEHAPGGVEIGVEVAGRPEVLAATFGATRRGGTTVAVGLPHPDRMLTVQALAFAGQGKTLVGSYMGSAAPQRDLPRYIAMWRAGKLPVEHLHTRTLDLDRINEAFESLAAGEAVRQVLVPPR